MWSFVKMRKRRPISIIPLENLTKALDIFYFPSSFKNNKTYQELNSSHVMLRTEALTRWSAGGNKKIIVTYPEALFEKVVLPETLAGNMIRLEIRRNHSARRIDGVAGGIWV